MGLGPEALYWEVGTKVGTCYLDGPKAHRVSSTDGEMAFLITYIPELRSPRPLDEWVWQE